MDLDFLLQTNWPVFGQGVVSGHSKALYEWCGKISQSVYQLAEKVKLIETEKNKLLEEKISKLETDLKTANDKIIVLENKPTTSTASNDSPFSFSSMVKGSGNNKEASVALLALVAKENREKSRIENNIVINGIIESNETDTLENDINKVNEVLNVLKLNREDVKKQTRIKNRTNLINETQPKVQMILVEFYDNTKQTIALKNSKLLKDNASTNSIYINPDKTAAERVAEKELRTERNRLNSTLESEVTNSNGRLRYGERNGKKFYWGIRWGELRRIEIKNQ